MANDRVGHGIFEVGFDRAQIRAAGETELLPVAQDLARGVAGAFAAIKIGGFVKGGLDELKEAERVSAQTEQQLKNLGGTAGITSDQIDALSQSMLDQSGVDDELAKSAANTALRLGVQGDAVRRVVQDANDLSQTYGDITSDSELLAKALAKPEQAARLLKPAIGALTDEQQKSIQAFIAQGDTAAAGAVILDAVEAKVRGAASAFGDTLAGAEKKATEEMKNAKAALVEGLAPGLQFGADLTIRFAHGIESLPGPLRAVGGAAVFAGTEIFALAQPAAALVSIIGRWRDTHAAAAEATKALAAAEAASTAATQANVIASQSMDAATLRRVVSNEQVLFTDEEVAAALAERQLAEFKALVSNDALIVSDEELAAAQIEVATTGQAAGLGLAAALGPIGLVVAGAGLLITALGLVSGGEHNAAVDTADFTEALKSNSGELDQNIDKVSAHALAQDEGARAATNAGVSYSAMFEAIRSGKDDFSTLRESVESLGVKEGLAGQGASEFSRELIAAADAGTLSKSQVIDLLQVLEDLHNKFLDQKTATDAEQTALAELGPTAAQTDSNMSGLSETLSDQAQRWALVAERTKDLNDAMNTQEQDRQTALDSSRALFEADQQYAAAQDNVKSALRGVEDAQQRVIDAQERLNEAMRPASANDLAKSQLDLSDAQLRVGDSADAVAAAQKNLTDLQNKGASADQIATAQRKLEEAQNSYQRSLLSVDDAEQRLQDTQQKGSDQDQAVITAKKNLADAVQGQQDASDRLQTAYVQEAQAEANVLDAQSKLGSGVEGVNVALGHQVDAYDRIKDKLDPNSPLRQNIDSYLGDLQVLRNVFEENPTQFQPPGDQTGLNSFVTGGTRAGGGWVPGGETFIGGEQGWELGIIPTNGIYQSPPQGVNVVPHDISEQMFGGRSRQVTINGGVTITGTDPVGIWHAWPDALHTESYLSGIG